MRIVCIKARMQSPAHPALDRRVLFLAMGCVGFIASAPVKADAATESDSADADSADIIVHGQRPAVRTGAKDIAPLLDTPRSVVVIDSDTIRRTGSATLADALRTVPGITFG